MPITPRVWFLFAAILTTAFVGCADSELRELRMQYDRGIVQHYA